MLWFGHDLFRGPVSIEAGVARGRFFRDDALMRGSSLATRLFLSATAWVVVILVITGVVLSSVYRDATERAFDRRLNLYLRTLVAEVATPDEPPDHQFQSLGEPLFELPLSGWYWQITRTDTERGEVRASRSLWDKKLPKLEEHGAELTVAGIRLGYVEGPEGQTLRMVERPVDLGADDGETGCDTRALQMMGDLIAHHIGLLQNLHREGIGAMRRGLVDDHRKRRLDGVGEVSDMGAGAFDDFLVGVDQRVRLTRERRDLDGKLALEPFGTARTDVGDRIRNAL